MTKRILAGFLGLLVFLLALVVGPLGAKISAQQRADFREGVRAAARAIAGAQEERLGDTTDPTDRRGAPVPSVDTGDGVAVLDRNGRIIATAGHAIPIDVLDAVLTGRPSPMPDAVVAVAPVGSPKHPDGTVVLARSSEPLDDRVRALWLALAVAAAVTLGLGAVTAAGLARWIGHPLHDLSAAAARMGHGDVAARSDDRRGPPEVRAVATAFNEMAQRIGALLNTQRTMTADVSHQLRTPLAALRLRLDLLAEDAPDDVRTELAGALREIARLNRLVDGLLAVSRAEETTAQPCAVDVAGVVRERVDMWEPLAQERGVTLSLSVQPAAGFLTPGHLDQVLDNLIGNAMDALNPGDRVAVSLHADVDEVVITVADNGPGMSPARRARAFDRFEGDESGRKAGLGLAIVARLVATDHGSISLDETAGGGLTAIVRLPVATAPALPG